jgi:flagellar hook-basal body complex protein FliE
MNTISTVQLPAAPPLLNPPLAGSQDSGTSFKDMLVNSVKQVNSMQLDADHAVEQMFTSDDINPAEVLTAVQKADLAFRLTMQIRNKLMDVYQEVQNIRI